MYAEFHFYAFWQIVDGIKIIGRCGRIKRGIVVWENIEEAKKDQNKKDG